MSESFSLADTLAVSDLQVYLSRAGRVEDGSVRLIAGSGVLAAYTAILYPRSLLDHIPTVLGLRTFVTDRATVFDAVVPTRSLLDRLARAADVPPGQDGEPEPIGIRLPLQVSTVTWAGITPPRGGWRKVGQTTALVLQRAAAEGIAEVAAAIPREAGEQLVQRVRGEVWGKPMPELEYVVAGAGFAAHSLGFVVEPDEIVTVHETGPWTRLTMRRGHVLVKRAAWSLRG
ncbi:hypothetical protein [Humibacter ginsenosidimutans]|uniref:Uncharacterized protein n=1 Tax=Humibacter ginsenosidimutans TaxID=2599293 RepID=A0A5B8M254_9MICO|nr:hypothetical protein [Humibacter ginsenosidimutans]QDZ14034.1 hypothetical protein FPZ11_03885 [Humibacter ginsenosidimutans]